MQRDRGVALILALLVLSFLTVLSGALLSTSTIDLWISDNYKSAAQSLYVAEAGISHAREMIHASGLTLSDLLTRCAGPDLQLATTDDEPLIPYGPLIDSFGKPSGYYEVWLRNDNADGAASPVDTNEVVTLVSRGLVGASRKTIEVTIQKGRFPESDTDPRLKNTRQLEAFASGVRRNATDLYTDTLITEYGSPVDYRIGVADGNAELGPGTGYGVLLVRGDLNVTGNVTWNGLVLVIGSGAVHLKPGVATTINGGLFLARTRELDGTLLSAPLDVSFVITDVGEMRAANRRFPYNPIAIRER
jgi:Tfp pilus assembly protein PilX